MLTFPYGFFMIETMINYNPQANGDMAIFIGALKNQLGREAGTRKSREAVISLSTSLPFLRFKGVQHGKREYFQK